MFERTIDCVFFVLLFSQRNASLRQAIAFLCLILGELEKPRNERSEEESQSEGSKQRVDGRKKLETGKMMCI